MQVKIRVEITDSESDEIIIRCRERTDRIKLVESVVENIVKGGSELALYLNNSEYYISKNDILFFETYDGKVWAHTSSHMYITLLRLFELEKIMPGYFVRISKSAVANVKLISSLRRELTGNGEITFKNCDKKVCFSRSYYKTLRDKIEEVRFGK